VFDVPPRTRRVIAVAGLAGLGLLVMGLLARPGAERLQVDKALHVGGFFAIAALLVLALRPVQFLPALLALGGLGVALEHVQRLVGRSFDRRDMAANAVGVALGAAAGLAARSVHAYLRGELAAADIRGRLRRLAPGEVLFSEGEAGSDFYLVRRGRIELRRGRDDSGPPLAVFGPGEVVGAAAAILGQARGATARAASPASVLPVTLDELVESAGGAGQPVGVVIRTLAERLRELVERPEVGE